MSSSPILRACALVVAGAVITAAAAVALAQPAMQARSSEARQPIAVIDGLALSREMLQSEDFASSRAERGQEIDGELQQTVAELQRMQTELSAMEQSSPQFQTRAQQFQQLQQQFQQSRQAGLNELNRLTASQFADIYARVEAAARAIADEQGYAYVISSTALPDTTAGLSFEDVRGTVLGRQMLVYPEGVDITQAVRDKLGIQPRAADDAAGDADPADGADQDSGS